uniref:NIDO domain-containing protein n=1 Tax=Leptobrachium leishanense TaxID=445787 RepID=A0A8C5Q3F1_9ANUR
MAFGNPFLAPFWGDVDNRIAGAIYYRQSTDSELLARATADVRSYFNSPEFSSQWVFVATWDRVAYFGSISTEQVNTFQIVVITDGSSTFVLFNYGAIQWTTGTASGGVNGLGGIPALGGVYSGDHSSFYTIPGSLAPEILNIFSTSNVNVPGRWAIKVDTHKPEFSTISGGGSWVNSSSDTPYTLDVWFGHDTIFQDGISDPPPPEPRYTDQWFTQDYVLVDNYLSPLPDTMNTNTDFPSTETLPPVTVEVILPPVTDVVTLPPVTDVVTLPPVTDVVTLPPVTDVVTLPPVTDVVTLPPVTDVVTLPPVTDVVTLPPVTDVEILPPVTDVEILPPVTDAVTLLPVTGIEILPPVTSNGEYVPISAELFIE